MTDNSSSPSATRDGSLVTEDPLFYYIHVSAGTVHVQRKRVLRATDNPLSSHEETILLLCKSALEPVFGLADLDFQRLNSGDYRALDGDHQWVFDIVKAHRETTRAETPQKPIAYGIQASDGSLFDKIAPCSYSLFNERMADMQEEPWVKCGRAKIVPLFLASVPSATLERTALLAFCDAFDNRGETTSLKE